MQSTPRQRTPYKAYPALVEVDPVAWQSRAASRREDQCVIPSCFILVHRARAARTLLISQTIRARWVRHG